jgi:hypothetical protein
MVIVSRSGDNWVVSPTEGRPCHEVLWDMNVVSTYQGSS